MKNARIISTEGEGGARYKKAVEPRSIRESILVWYQEHTQVVKFS